MTDHSTAGPADSSLPRVEVHCELDMDSLPDYVSLREAMNAVGVYLSKAITEQLAGNSTVFDEHGMPTGTWMVSAIHKPTETAEEDPDA